MELGRDKKDTPGISRHLRIHHRNPYKMIWENPIICKDFYDGILLSSPK